MATSRWQRPELPATGSIVVVHDVAASWEGYGAIASSLRPPPEGLLLHAAGPTDEGFRIVEVWDSEGASARFRPVLEAALRAVDPVVQPLTVIRELKATHVVVGAARASPGSSSPGDAHHPGDIGG
jgi:hypothetical protein